MLGEVVKQWTGVGIDHGTLDIMIPIQSSDDVQCQERSAGAGCGVRHDHRNRALGIDRDVGGIRRWAGRLDRRRRLTGNLPCHVEDR